MTQTLHRLCTLLIAPLTLGMSVFTIWDLFRAGYFTLDISPISSSKQPLCVGTVNPTVRISRATLAWLIAVPTGSDQHEVMQQLGAPYCQLPSSGELTQVAYPCEWDPSTWIVVVLQSRQYAGYTFRFDNSLL
jgi:hypothetical protein